MKRLLLLLTALVMLVSCEKQTISEKYIGFWDGVLYAIIDSGDGEKIAIVQNVIELTIDESASYTCVIYKMQCPGGVPIKIGEGQTYKGDVIEMGESISFAKIFNDNIFKQKYCSQHISCMFLVSSEYMLDLCKK